MTSASFLMLLIDRYGFRLTTADLADLMNTTPAEIRNQISAGMFPIPIGIDAFHDDFFTDVRDVSEYLDTTRPGKSREEQQPYMSWQKKRQFIFERDSHTCQYCGATNEILEVDHVIPKSRGGSNDPDNLKTACWDCNRSKGRRLLSEWKCS